MIPSLPVFRQPLEEALRGYERVHRITFGTFLDIEPTPDKPYTAKTVVPVLCAGVSVGEMTVVVFIGGDGTGNQTTYDLHDVIISPDLRHVEQQDRIIPRSKKGIVAEGYFPLFTQRSNDAALFPFAGSLEELTLDDSKQIVRAWTLGRGLYTPKSPMAHFTLGTDAYGNRFGDPHAIYNQHRGSVQVAGFLPILDERNPLLPITDGWILPTGHI